MKKLFIGLTVLATLLVVLMTSNDNETIIVYASTEQFRNDEMQRQLNEKFPDLKIRVMYTPTAKAAAKLKIEKEKSDADIVVGIDSAYMGSFADALADIEGLSKVDYLDDLAPETHDNKFVTWERFGGSFIVNKEILSKYNLEAPKTYQDLLKPEYKGLIAMPDPKSSGTGYFFYLNMVNQVGEEAALEYFDALEKNIKQFTESGSGPIKLLTQGEIAIAMGMTFQAVNQINNNMPFEIIFPEQGSPFSLTATGLVKGREENEDIMRVFDFIINDFLIFDKLNYSPELIYKDQEILVPNYPADIEYADMSNLDDILEKERLLELWKY